MKRRVPPEFTNRLAHKIYTALWIQPPLPSFLDTLPILLSIEGQGSGRQGPPPPAPPEEPAHDK